MPADIVAEIMCRYACYGFKINVWELEKNKSRIIIIIFGENSLGLGL